MADRTERGVLNSLIVACRDADKGFTFAAEHVRSAPVRTLFTELAEERRQFAEALLPHAQRLGGAADGDGSAWATLHRAWMALKDQVAHQDHTILIEAERGEKAALAAYRDALNGMLPPETREVVEAQEAGIHAALERIHAMSTAAG
jgi:uncharacterized protein (TIGR02284 family)